MAGQLIIFQEAGVAEHRVELLNINVEYAMWVASELDRSFQISLEAALGMSMPDYIESALDKICGDMPPEGIFYLLKVGGQIAGMCGLRKLRDDAGEIKRVYVRPGRRGMHLGERMVQQLIDDARTFGYKRLLIDTAPFMKSAHRIYEAAGFVDCPPYEEAETPEALHNNWRFMEREI